MSKTLREYYTGSLILTDPYDLLTFLILKLSIYFHNICQFDRYLKKNILFVIIFSLFYFTIMNIIKQFSVNIPLIMMISVIWKVRYLKSVIWTSYGSGSNSYGLQKMKIQTYENLFLDIHRYFFVTWYVLEFAYFCISISLKTKAIVELTNSKHFMLYNHP